MGFWFTPRFCDCRRFLVLAVPVSQAFFIRHFDFFEVASSIAGANISPRPPALQGTASPVFPEGKKVQDWDYVFGSWMTFQRRKKWICESRCQVSDRLHVFAVLFCLLTLPSLQFTLGLHFTPSLQSSFFILHPAYLILSVSTAVFILHSVCILCLVRSQQSSVYHIH